MKKLIGIALVLALALGIAAFAETVTDTAPTVTEEATAPEETAPVPAATAEVTKVEDDSAALKDAMDAYRSAKQQKALADLEEELNGYVEAGTMTQEQADLVLNSAKERMAAKNNQCPGCGYQFQGKGAIMGGQMRGGMRRGQMNGGMQQPDAQSGATPQMPQQPRM